MVTDRRLKVPSYSWISCNPVELHHSQSSFTSMRSVLANSLRLLMAPLDFTCAAFPASAVLIPAKTAAVSVPETWRKGLGLTKPCSNVSGQIGGNLAE